LRCPKAPNPPPKTSVHDVLLSPLEFVADGRTVERQNRTVESQRIDNIGATSKPDMPVQPKMDRI
jgi:hypothetical protein